MKRRIINLLTALSLLLCVAAAGFWVRSYWSAELFTYTRLSGQGATIRTQAYFLWRPGRCVVSWLTSRYDGVPYADQPGYKFFLDEPGFRHERVDPNTLPQMREDSRLRRMGFGFGHSHTRKLPTGWQTISATFDETGFVVPDWAILLVFATLPISRLIMKLRGQRFKPGHCRVCGYDLRATPERCPECGTSPATKITAPL